MRKISPNVLVTAREANAPTGPAAVRPAVLRNVSVTLDSMDGTNVNRLRVWIDQDLCTGDGICTDHAPEVFTILEDGIAYCMEGTGDHRKTFNDPGGSAELALVPFHAEAEVVASAAECPGECIFIEFDQAPEITEGDPA